MSSTGAIPKGARPKTGRGSSKVADKLYSEVKSADIEFTSQPLEIKMINSSSDGILMKRPALDKYWMERKTYIPFMIPPQPNDSDGDFIPGAIEAWNEQIEFLIQDLRWILSLPHHKFWSQILHDKALHETLESYLSGRSRWYEDNIPDEKFGSYLETTNHLVFLIYVRMATFKESKEDYITPSTFAHLIYENFLFDICKVIDLCVLYSSSNELLLKKMVDNIFTHQPKYYNDLTEFISSLKKVFENIENELGLSKLSLKLSSQKEKLSLSQLGDIIEYLVDIFCSLDALLKIFPKSAEKFTSASFDISLAAFYEKIIPTLANILLDFGELPQNELWILHLTQRLSLARVSCIAIFRKIVEHSCCCILPQDVSQENVPSFVESCIEKFTHTFTTCIEEKTFITDYALTHSIEKDIQQFKDYGTDMTTLNFVLEAVNSTVSDVKESMDVPTCDRTETPEDNSLPIPIEGGQKDSSGMNGYYSGVTAQITQVEEASLISNIKDLLSDLGSGFIKDCLVHYNYSTEEVLNAILEDNLPPNLQSIPRDKELVKGSSPPKQEITQEEKDLKQDQSNIEDLNAVLSRTNVYDDDEFDVFSTKAKVDMKKIHKGKKNYELEKDPTLRSKVKEIGYRYETNLGYSIYEDETKYMPITVQDYDDEYDDTYDDNNAGDLDNFTLDKKKKCLPTLRGTGALNAPGLDFANKGDESESSSEEGNHDAANMPPSRPHLDTKEIKEMSGQFRRENRPYQGKKSSVFENRKFKRGNNPTPQVNGDSADSHDAKNGQGEQNYRSTFNSFCENPEELRRRAEERRLSKMQRKRNWNYGANASTWQESHVDHSEQPNMPSGGGVSRSQRGRGKNLNPMQNGETHSTRNTQHATNNDVSHGGQKDNSYRYKTAHKNQDRRRASQAKYRGGFS